MGARSTVFCSSCGTENPVSGRFCSACGAPLGVVTPQAAPVAVVASTVATPPTGPTVVREGIVASPLQRFAIVAAALCAVAALLVVVLGFGTGGLAWGSRGEGFVKTIAHPAPGYVVGVFLIILLNAAFFRRLAPRRRDIGMAALRKYRRNLRERDGIRFLMAPGGVRPGVVIMSLLWIGIGGIAWYNVGSLGDEGLDLGVGLYLSMMIPVAGVIANVCLWPFRPEIAYMDAQGVITRG